MFVRRGRIRRAKYRRAGNQRPVIIPSLNYIGVFFGSGAALRGAERSAGGFLFSRGRTRKRNSPGVSRFSTARPFHLQAHQSPASFSVVSVLPMGARMQSRTLITGRFSFPFFLRLSGSVAQLFIIISRARSIGGSAKSNVCLTFCQPRRSVPVRESCIARDKRSVYNCFKSRNSPMFLAGQIFPSLNRTRKRQEIRGYIDIRNLTRSISTNNTENCVIFPSSIVFFASIVK